MKTRGVGILLRVVMFAIVAVLLYFNNKKTNKIKEQLKSVSFEGFNLFFENLLRHKLKTNYIGLASNTNNCLYFHNEKGKINIEFEVVEKEQLNYVKKLLSYAENLNFEVIETSYANKTKYDKTIEAPVYQIISKLDVTNASFIAKEIFTQVFNEDNTTKFEMVY